MQQNKDKTEKLARIAVHETKGIETLKLVTALAISAVSAALGLFQVLLGRITELNQYRPGAVKLIFIVVGFIAMQVLMTFVIMVKQRPTKGASLKAKLISSFCEALDSSPLNPSKKKEDARA